MKLDRDLKNSQRNLAHDDVYHLNFFFFYNYLHFILSVNRLFGQVRTIGDAGDRYPSGK